MKRILVTGAGGAPGTNFVRSLRAAPEQFHFIGTDCNEFYLQRAETDERYLIPRADENDYIDILNEIIDQTNAQFLDIQTGISHFNWRWGILMKPKGMPKMPDNWW